MPALPMRWEMLCASVLRAFIVPSAALYCTLLKLAFAGIFMKITRLLSQSAVSTARSMKMFAVFVRSPPRQGPRQAELRRRGHGARGARR